VTEVLSKSNFHIETLTRNEWLDAWSKSPYGTFFEHPDWFDAWNTLHTTSEAPTAFRFESESGLSFVIPCLRRKLAKGLVGYHECGPGGLYAGPLDLNNSALSPDFSDLKEALKTHFKHYSFRVNPFLCESVGLNVSHPATFTQVTSLYDFDKVLSDLQKSGVLYDSRSAERKGLRLVKTTAESAQAYFTIYEQLRKTWKTAGSFYPLEFFERLMQSKQCDTWSIVHENTYIGGAIILVGVNHVSSWLTIMNPEITHLRPYEFAYHNLLEHYHLQGYRWFDFNPSAGLEGVVRFKEKFGTAKLPFLQYENQHGLTSLFAAIRKVLK
jgi:hypothetical protein